MIMKNVFLSAAMILTLSLGFVACGDDAADEATEGEATTENVTEEAPEETPATAAEMVEGVQVITVKVEDMGYTPSRIALKAGVPAKIIFDQHGTTKCAWDVMSKDLGIPLTDLPEGEVTEVEFTPGEGGTYSFTCGMDMMKGTVIVDEA